MHFKIAKSAQSYFNNIMNLEGSHAAEDKNKFIQFDVLFDKPTSREEFLDAFNVAMQFYEKKDS